VSFDLLITGGLVYDGSGRRPVKADLGLRDGRVAEIGHLRGSGGPSLDAGGLAVAPGFIDTHGHSDLSVVVNPVAESQVAQGITTEVFGHCGMSPFPLSERSAGAIFHWVKAATPGRPPFDWYGAQDYFKKVRRQGIGLNLVPLQGHLTARAEVVGEDDRPLTDDELARLLALIDEGLVAGCRGITSGVFYPPSRSADAAELAACARLMHSHPGAAVYTAHVRDQDDGIQEAVEEFLDVGRRAGVPVHVSHLGVGWRANRGKARRVVDRLAALRSEGFPVTADVLPYPNKGHFWAPRVVLPEEDYDFRKPWRAQAITLQIRLADPAFLEALVARLEAEPVCADAAKWGVRADEIWDAIVVEEARSALGREATGLTVADAAAKAGTTPARLFVGLLKDDGPDLSAVVVNTFPEDEEAVLACPFISFGTDSTATRVEDEGSPLELMQAHPRMYGTFPRVLGLLARDKGLLAVEEAVRRMTSLPASIYGLANRGTLKPGAWADVVVFDPAAVGENGTFRCPRAYPRGIECVLVNGVPVLQGGRFTGELPGRLLTRGVE